MFEIDNTANLTDANRNGTQITRLINKRPNVKNYDEIARRKESMENTKFQEEISKSVTASP